MGYRPSWTSVSPLPHHHPLGWQVCLVLGPAAAPGHQVILFPPMGHGHPQEHGPGGGAGTGLGTAFKRVGGDRLAPPALGVVSSPLCILPAALERCALVPGSHPRPGWQEARTGEAGSGAASQSGGREGRCPQAHSIQELPETHVLNSLSQVRERDLPFVTHTLSSEFTILRVVNGETVAAENLGITNGFVKPKMGESEGGGLGWKR